jgi:uncharacterized membrane protein YphA (DoxX/SURF4 family)
MNSVVAHVKWFVEGPHEIVNELSAIEIGVLLFVVVLGLRALKFLNDNLKINQLDKASNKLWPYLPLIVRLSAGLMFLLNAVNGVIIAPNFDINATGAPMLSLLFVIVGTLFILGLFTRLAAMLLLVTFLLCTLSFPMLDLLDHLEIIGLASFLLITGGGKASLDDKFQIGSLVKSSSIAKANRSLQIWSGLAVVSLALTEKLFGISLAHEFLQVHSWNFVDSFGVSDRLFIVFAGVTELIVGLSLILGWATRLTTLALLGLMIITASLLGLHEIYGHLFAVAVVASVWVAQPVNKVKSAKKIKSKVVKTKTGRR